MLSTYCVPGSSGPWIQQRTRQQSLPLWRLNSSVRMQKKKRGGERKMQTQVVCERMMSALKKKSEKVVGRVGGE